jgi:phage baseplate assembly protein W
MNTPPLPKTYATLRWTDDMDPGAADTASDLESLEQDCLHVIMQTRGSNLADPDSGCGASTLLNGTVDQLAALCTLIDAQLPEDPRVTASQSTLTTGGDGSPLLTTIVQVGAQVLTLKFNAGPNGLEQV